MTIRDWVTWHYALRFAATISVAFWYVAAKTPASAGPTGLFAFMMAWAVTCAIALPIIVITEAVIVVVRRSGWTALLIDAFFGFGWTAIFVYLWAGAMARVI